MKIGVQMYTIRDYLKNPEDIHISLKKVKALGFDMIQLSGLGPCNIDQLAGWIKGLGMTVCSTHSPWERIDDKKELLKLIEEHKKLGASEIGIGMKPDIFPQSYEGWSRFIKKVNSVCKICKDNGMTFGYHNHSFEFEKIKGVCIIDRLVEECPDMNIILDVFWVQAGGANPSAYIDKLKGRIQLLHLKDFRIANWDKKFAEIGNGNLDWNDIIPRARKNGIPYAAIEQDGDFAVEPFESLAASKKYLVKSGLW